MKSIVLTSNDWQDVLDFYAALKVGVGAPEWHGDSIDSFVDSMIWGGVNRIEAPYVINIQVEGALDPKLLSEIINLRNALRKARDSFLVNKGKGCDVSVVMEGLG